MDTIAFPIRFVDNQVVKLIDGTTQYYNQMIALAVQILPGELIMDDSYGTPSFVFENPTKTGIEKTISEFFPEIFIEQIAINQNTANSTYSVNVVYTY